MTERIKREVSLVQSAHGEVDVDADLRWFVIRRWPLVAGWNKESTRLLVLVPPGYPITAPDNFFTDPDLTVKGATDGPGNSSVVQMSNEQWRQFSYHIEQGDWQPEKGHDLLTFLAAVARRLREVS